MGSRTKIHNHPDISDADFSVEAVSRGDFCLCIASFGTRIRSNDIIGLVRLAGCGSRRKLNLVCDGWQETRQMIIIMLGVVASTKGYEKNSSGSGSAAAR